MKNIIITVLVLVLAFAAWFYFNPTPKTSTPPATTTARTTETQKITYTNATSDLIIVDSPLPGSTVGEHVAIAGKARGMWYFEATFLIEALDASGKVLARSPAQAQGEWMTTEFVPFKATLDLPASYTGQVTLVFKKDNPSDLRQNDASISFPVIKQIAPGNTTNMKIFFYKATLDQGPGGAQCSKAGLVSVTRTIPRTITPIQDAIRLLLSTPVSTEERAQGLSNEFPLLGISLQAASVRNGTLTLTFLDPQNKSGGGSCRTSILRNQIEATATQFPEVKSVVLMPQELFQP